MSAFFVCGSALAAHELTHTPFSRSSDLVAIAGRSWCSPALRPEFGTVVGARARHGDTTESRRLEALVVWMPLRRGGQARMVRLLPVGHRLRSVRRIADRTGKNIDILSGAPTKTVVRCPVMQSYATCAMPKTKAQTRISSRMELGIESLIAGGETYTVEFKSDVNDVDGGRRLPRRCRCRGRPRAEGKIARCDNLRAVRAPGDRRRRQAALSSDAAPRGPSTHDPAWG